MTIKEFIKEYQPCEAGSMWLRKTFKQTDDAAKMWDELMRKAVDPHDSYVYQDWLIWLLSKPGLYCNQEYWKYTFELFEDLHDSYCRTVLGTVHPELEQEYADLKKLVKSPADDKEYRKLFARTWKFTQNPLKYGDMLLAGVIGRTGHTAFIKVITNLRLRYTELCCVRLLFKFLRDRLHNPFFNVETKVVTHFRAKKIRLKPKWRTKRVASLPSR